MRLLNTRTKELREFYKAPIPYAILSHTWGPEEVSYQDLISGNGEGLQGYEKIEGTCNKALSDGFDYIWIDTCCIDKTSSAELTEAINSMWNWYRDSKVCYAYLQDVPTVTLDDWTEFQALTQGDPTKFGSSRWFTRGWTLQELIAPHMVIFLSQDWGEIGFRDNLEYSLGKITGINHEFFKAGFLSQYSIAQKMSWAANRTTTRVEDQAYCLMGLFGVNMPLLYGEGEMAFIRLQEEIMRRTDDQSIFAWIQPQLQPKAWVNTGFLAPSPSCFSQSGSIVKVESGAPMPPYAFTNQGIQITLHVLEEGSFQMPFVPHEGEELSAASGIGFSLSPVGTIAILGCRHEVKGWRVGIYMESSVPGSSLYYRCNHGLGFVKVPNARAATAKPKTILVGAASNPQDLGSLWEAARVSHFVLLNAPPPEARFGFDSLTLDPPDVWTEHEPGSYSTTLSFLWGKFNLQNASVHAYFQNEAKQGFCLFLDVDEEGVVKSYLDLNLQDVFRPVRRLQRFARREILQGHQKQGGDGEHGLRIRVGVDSSRFGNVFDLSIDNWVPQTR